MRDKQNPSEIPAIEFRQVSISFDEIPALEEVSFRLMPGQMICITGDSQAGKSVLLRTALGFIRPDKGDVLIDGVSITALEETDLLALRREKMGMVFQEAAMFTSQNVFQNTAYRLSDREWPEEQIDKAVLEILTFVGLQDELEKQAEELSGGMKRRLELARALIGWPPLMLFDEPTAGLDPINAKHVLNLIIRARDLQHTTSLLVTKALHEIPYLARHQAARHQATDGAPGEQVIETQADVPNLSVMLLDRGRIAFFGSPAEFAQSRLPAVQHLLHPLTGANHDHLEVADPWRQNRKTKPD